MDFRATNVIPFWYDTQIVCGAAGTFTGNLTLAIDSEFECWNIYGQTSIDAVGDFTSNNFTVKINFQSSGADLMNANIPQRILCAPSNKETRWPHPVVYPPGSIFIFTAVVTQALTLDVVFWGYKIFNRQRG